MDLPPSPYLAAHIDVALAHCGERSPVPVLCLWLPDLVALRLAPDSWQPCADHSLLVMLVGVAVLVRLPSAAQHEQLLAALARVTPATGAADISVPPKRQRVV